MLDAGKVNVSHNDEPKSKTMKYPLIAAILAPLFFSCEHKETVINPPDKNETTIINPPSSSTEKKTETETTVTPGGTTTEKKETIEKK